MVQLAFLLSTLSWTCVSNFKSMELIVWVSWPFNFFVLECELQRHHLADWAHITWEAHAYYFQLLGQVSCLLLIPAHGNLSRGTIKQKIIINRHKLNRILPFRCLNPKNTVSEYHMFMREDFHMTLDLDRVTGSKETPFV